MCDGAPLPPLALPLLLLLVWGLDPGTGSAPAPAVLRRCLSRPPCFCPREASRRPAPARAALPGRRSADSAQAGEAQAAAAAAGWGSEPGGRAGDLPRVVGPGHGGAEARAGRSAPARGRAVRVPSGPVRDGRPAGERESGRAGGPRRADTSPLSPSAVGDAAADVEVVLPRRVRPDDVHLPPLLPGVPGPRRRRRPRAPPAAPRPPPGERALLLHLPAFGRDLYLQLRRDLRFLSRGFEVEEAGEAWRRGRPAELCFYSGRVLGHPGSLVSVSTCGAAGGLVLPPPLPSASAPPSAEARGVVPQEGWGSGGWGCSTAGGGGASQPACQ